MSQNFRNNPLYFIEWLLIQGYSTQCKLGNITPGEPYIVRYDDDCIRIEPIEPTIIAFDPALSGADRTVVLGIERYNLFTGSLKPLNFEPSRRFMIHKPVIITEPQPNHPDGWYRKFEKCQRGAKCLKK